MMIRKILMLLASMALAVLVVGSAALAADIICGSDPCFGTDEADHIDGTDSAEVIRALDGDDTIDGLNGRDTLYGGPGNDVFLGERASGINGGNGHDLSFGGPGNDFLTEFDESRHNECTGRSPVGARSCTGRDTMRGGEGEDRLEGANGGDSLHGNEGADLLIGYAGNDVVRGGPDADRIGGFEENDRLMGNSGDDEIDSAFFETPGSRDTVSCGRGRDEVIANRNDVVRGDCERVDRRPNPTVPPFSGDGGSAGSSRSFAADLEKAREELLANNKPSG